MSIQCNVNVYTIYLLSWHNILCLKDFVYGYTNIYVKSYVFHIVWNILLHPTINFRLKIFTRVRFFRFPSQRMIVKKNKYMVNELFYLKKSSNINITMDSRSPMARYIKIPIKLPSPSGLWLLPRHSWTMKLSAVYNTRLLHLFQT